MRKFLLLTSACAVVLIPCLASAQRQLDFMASGGILESLAVPSDTVNFKPPAEKGGIYVGLGGNLVGLGPKHRFGFNLESSWRYHQGSYYGYENIRPIFTDFNALYQPPLVKSKKIGVDVFAGVGVASNRFTVLTSCSIPGCINYTSSNHFLEDLGVGVRYYVWHRLPHTFLRAEGHYYHIQNNVEFNSSNVFRVGGSIGYTFGQ